MIKNCTKEKGITLIALVITIIVLLILAGISITLVIGSNGIINRAQEAEGKYSHAVTNELEKTNNFEKEFNEYYKNTVNEEVIEKDINYVTDNKGNKIPVPKGFAYLTGDKENGFVIKNKTDGNEFVWIPTDKSMPYSYDRYGFNQDISNYRESLSIDEEGSVTKYGGYYIGRYETASEDNKVVVKENMPMIRGITRARAQQISEGLYDKEKDKIQSRLCSSYAWDTSLRFIENKNPGSLNQDTMWSTITGKDAPLNNIYDMRIIIWKWTTEDTTSNLGVVRGYGNPINRYGTSKDYSLDDVTFRIALFMGI